MTKRIHRSAVFLVTAFLFAGAGAIEAADAKKPAPTAASPKTPSNSSTPPAKSAKPAAVPSKDANPAIVPTPRSEAADGKPGNPSRLGEADSFESGRISFSLRYSGVESPYARMSAFVLPGEVLEIEAVGGSGLFAASSRTGKLVADEKKPIWRWTAPARHGGDHQIRIRDRSEGKTDFVMLRVFVMHPYDGGTTIGEYPVGQYAAPPKKNAEAFTVPRGFVEVTDDNRDTPVSPHFEIGQFLCRDGVKGPRYVALKPALLLKLEHVLEELAERGMPAKTLEVISGFRTPAYNAGIGNETSLSRHLYGDAADVFLDRDDDGEMDDLDGDGAVTTADADVLQAVVDEVVREETGKLAGGLSSYRASDDHGPFVHIDTRGMRVRW